MGTVCYNVQREGRQFMKCLSFKASRFENGISSLEAKSGKVGKLEGKFVQTFCDYGPSIFDGPPQ